MCIVDIGETDTTFSCYNEPLPRLEVVLCSLLGFWFGKVFRRALSCENPKIFFAWLGQLFLVELNYCHRRSGTIR